MSVRHLAKQRHKAEVFSKVFYQTACSMKDKPKVAKLVGKKCMLQCRLNDIVMPVLMDTGAQVSIIEKIVLEERFLDNKVKLVDDLVDDGDNFRVQWRNSHDIPFRGFVELSDKHLEKINHSKS